MAQLFFSNKIQRLKLKINEVLCRPYITLIHLRHLGLKKLRDITNLTNRSIVKGLKSYETKMKLINKIMGEI